MSKVDFKKSTSNFPSSGVSNDTLYFKTDTNNVQMKLGSMPLRNDVVSLSFTHSIDSTSTDSILETTSDYINTPYDGLKITIADISDSGTVGYRFGSNSTGISINGDAKRIFGITGADPLTSSQIEPTGVNYILMLQYSSLLNNGSGGWQIVGQYGALPTAGGEMTGGIDMNLNNITGLAASVNTDDAVTRGETLVLENNVFVPGLVSPGGRNDYVISNVAAPNNNTDAANKKYVDDEINSAISGITIDTSPTLSTDLGTSSFDGTKDYNYLYLQAVTAPNVNNFNVASGKYMTPGHMCHIFLYKSGNGNTPGTYNTTANYKFRIPCDLCVGGQASNNNLNYVWINGQLVHGDGIGDGEYKYYLINSTSSRSNMCEMSIFYSRYPLNNPTQYRTIIKLDADETTAPLPNDV